MSERLFSPDLQSVLDVTGIFVFGLSGGLLAVRKNLDVFGIAVLAEVTALGGGVLRDLLIGAVPPAAFRSRGYFLAPLVATVVVFFLHPQVARINRSVQTLDALGLGLFAVTGTAKADDYGLGVFAAVALGIVSGAGGGVIRDVLADEVPALLRWDQPLYAVPALVGAVITQALVSAHAFGPLGGTLAVLAAFGVRMLALHYHWRAPRVWPGRGARGPRA